jgi:hypothetical protein
MSLFSVEQPVIQNDWNNYGVFAASLSVLVLVPIGYKYMSKSSQKKSDKY